MFATLTTDLIDIQEHGQLRMDPDITREDTKDLRVLRLLTRLVNETDKLIRLADDIDTHATTPQAKEAFNLIGKEVDNILALYEDALRPLYGLYELDPGLKELEQVRSQDADL